MQLERCGSTDKLPSIHMYTRVYIYVYEYRELVLMKKNHIEEMYEENLI